MGAVVLLVIGAVIIVSTIIGVAAHYKNWVNTHYICPGCQFDFKPSGFKTSLFAIFGKEYKRLSCPKCGLLDLMKGIEE